MSPLEDTLYFITGNSHKFHEVSTAFQKEHLPFKLEQLDLDPIESQSDSLVDVAKFKLKNSKSQIKGSFFVEDAGFFVDAPLNGFPGVYSSYVFKTIGNKGILRLIDDYAGSIAHFKAVIAFYSSQDDEIYIFEGIVRGTVSSSIRGSHGFGYDPIFIPNSIPEKTFAELTSIEKNQISHRGKALGKFITFLKKKYETP